VPPQLLALALVLGVLALMPTRRLAQLGWSPGSLAAYYVALWLLAIVAATAGGLGRLLVPLVLVVWLVPFLDWRQGLGRLLGQPPREPERPIRDVTPPDESDQR
jgi:hypothetical protein